MYKRQRTDNYSFPEPLYDRPAGPALPPAMAARQKAKSAYWANRRFNQLHPWSTYGAARIKRGTKFSLDRFGSSYKDASDAQKKRRKMFGFTGKGMYYGQGSYFSRMMHRQLNRTLAGQTPLGHLGKKIGRNLLGRVEGAVLGQGSYDIPAVQANNLVAGGGLSVPSFVTSQDETGALHIQHSEYIKDIYGLPWSDSGLIDTFKNDSIHLNPGIARNFPWLSQVASNYEEYEFKQLMFCFKTRVGDNLTTTDGQVGTVMMFTDYNATDKARKTKQDMLQAYGTSVAKITDNDVLHGIECDPSKIKGDAHKFVRTGSNDEDLHDFDWGLFQIAVDNTPQTLSNKVIGELYVSYTVVLRKPRLYSTLGLAIQQDQFYIQGIQSAIVNGAVEIATVSPVGSAVTNSLGCALSTDKSGGTAFLNVTLPSSLSGAIELIWTNDKATTDLNGIVQPYLISVGGNVELARDLATGSRFGGVNPADDSDPNAITGDNTFTNIYSNTIVIHLNVEMASKDIDNKVHLGLIMSTENVVVRSHLMVRRYNNNELSVPPTFKDSDGAVISIPAA